MSRDLGLEHPLPTTEAENDRREVQPASGGAGHLGEQVHDVHDGCERQRDADLPQPGFPRTPLHTDRFRRGQVRGGDDRTDEPLLRRVGNPLASIAPLGHSG
jgi:hypothetical protein